MKNIYLIEGARTPFGGFGGGLKSVTDIDLGVVAGKEAIARSGVDPKEIDHVFFGNVIHTSKSASYLARHISLKIGIPEGKPALIVSRACGSGVQSIISAVHSILAGDSEVALAGGTENMSQSPHVLRNTRFGTGLKAPVMDDMLLSSLTDEYIGCGMGRTAENLAEKYQISREEQDEFAAVSHHKAYEAIQSGRFAEEIVPVVIPDRKKGEKIISQDEHVKGDTSVEKLSNLKPSFKNGGTVTAGNASGINDGAAAVVIASEDFLQANPQIKPLAKIKSWGIAGVDPHLMGIGPVPSSRIALQKTGLSVGDIDLFELNEAFAAQSIAVINELQIDPNKVNVNGGAIALGHPVGASGTRITYSLALELHKRNLKYGLATLCIGGGQGISIVIEKV
ncbi:acetyl-CoA C-acetyltransferase [Bacillus sp. B15-48]|uniref:thiolase family protein n=1 Tax=Bacillus sp. B15-48 TaxID=1548601 RepID=UPI0019400E24|nr:acetyl-CoA C-acetyltransferase [Bacillus sp. B15-48]MBM4763788.1 acetyl-CoA C-acyltransferase [Bacillus sp. B15-48]